MLSSLLLSPTGLLFAARPPRLPITTMLAADRGGGRSWSPTSCSADATKTAALARLAAVTAGLTNKKRIDAARDVDAKISLLHSMLVDAEADLEAANEAGVEAEVGRVELEEELARACAKAAEADRTALEEELAKASEACAEAERQFMWRDAEAVRTAQEAEAEAAKAAKAAAKAAKKEAAAEAAKEVKKIKARNASCSRASARRSLGSLTRKPRRPSPRRSAGQQIAQLKEVESALARESAVCESLMAQLGNAEAAIEREKESRVELALEVDKARAEQEEALAAAFQARTAFRDLEKDYVWRDAQASAAKAKASSAEMALAGAHAHAARLEAKLVDALTPPPPPPPGRRSPPRCRRSPRRDPRCSSSSPPTRALRSSPLAPTWPRAAAPPPPSVRARRSRARLPSPRRRPACSGAVSTWVASPPVVETRSVLRVCAVGVGMWLGDQAAAAKAAAAPALAAAAAAWARLCTRADRSWATRARCSPSAARSSRRRSARATRRRAKVVCACGRRAGPLQGGGPQELPGAGACGHGARDGLVQDRAAGRSPRREAGGRRRLRHVVGCTLWH